jgi:gas vesicle protein
MVMTDKEFLEKLEHHPDLKNRFKELLSIADNSGKELVTLADEAEMRVIAQMRQLGKETLQDWADSEANRVSKNVKSQMKDAKKHVKKN